EQYIYPSVQFNWSPAGALAWIGQDILHSIPPSSSWQPIPCPCSGVAHEGESLVALESDGQALLRYTQKLNRVQRIPTPELPDDQPMLMGVARAHAVVAAFSGTPERSTPSSLYILDMSGHVR